VTVGGARDGGPVHTVLVPPLLCSPRIYADVVPVVWQSGSVAVADTRHDVTMAGIAARLLADAPERFALVGTSMGGYVALEVVRQAPERIAALGLISTSGRPDSGRQAESRTAQAAAARQDFDGLVEAAFPALTTPDLEDDPALRAVWRTMAHEVGAEAFIRQLQAITSRVDTRSALAALDCPIAVVHGTADRLLDVEVAHESAALAPAARVTLVPGAGHFVVLEQPEPVHAALRDLLAAA
jgi:pimeloyl-ACP methyl ester carboxylesterase